MRKPIANNHVSMYLVLEEMLYQHRMRLFVLIVLLLQRLSHSNKRKTSSRPYRMLPKIPSQVRFINRMVNVSDRECMLNLRMDRNTFGRLCQLLKQFGGLGDGKYVSLEEQVAIFLSILAHHKKNQVLGFNFQRSGQTISEYVHRVLRAVIKLHALFLAKPKAVDEFCTDSRWKHFQGCVGALDGTYIHVKVSNNAKARYRNRKGQVTTNTLAACDQNLNFIYVLPGWEGSAADGRVLRDAVIRPHGLKVPCGSYFLCDNAYANCDGFLVPFKGVRYHLKEWGPENRQPQNAEEIFNLKHTRARNCIERAFGVLKMRLGILRSVSYYPIRTQNRLIMSCFLIHNFIRSQMTDDPIERELDTAVEIPDDDADDQEEYVDCVEPSSAWNEKRRDMATHMWNTFRA